MNPSREEALFKLALSKPAAKRAAWLDAECDGDAALRQRLEALLAAHEPSETLLATQAETARPTLKPGFADAPDEAVGQTLGRYKLLERIGEGGCGVVYVAEQSQPVRRRVALKVIKLGMDTKQVVARFEAERQALAMMDHPNIAKVLDAGMTGDPEGSAGCQPAVSPAASRPDVGSSSASARLNAPQAGNHAIQQFGSLRHEPELRSGRPFFVMELVRGIKITDYCDQANLTTKERLDLFIKVCQAIQHAHQKGIIHRDIKPSNILVTLHDGVPVPKVIDFGIAKATEGRLTDSTVYTQLHQFIGTPAYMSPEQAEMSGLDIDTRSDIYSLGVLLYELLAGSTPFDGQELMASGLDAMRKTIREKEPQRPSTKLSQILVAAEVTRRTSGNAEASASSTRRLQEQLHQLKGDLDWIVMKCLEKDRTRRYDTANGLAADLTRHLTNEPVLARPPTVAYTFQKAWRRNKLLFSAGAIVAAALVLGIGVSTWQAVRATRAEKEQSKLREVAAKALDGEKEQRAQADTQARKAIESQAQSRRLLYASDMNLAQQSHKEFNLGKARRLLDRHRPQPGEEDLRGWEWRYLWQLTRSSALKTLTNRPTTRGWSVSFSPDGTRLAAGWLDGRVDLWDISGRRLVRALTDREQHHQGHVAFSPVRNLLAATSEPKAVSMYDLDSGHESVFWRASDQGDWRVRNLSFSPDGSKLVIYARSGDSGLGDEVLVVNVSSTKIESRHPTVSSASLHGFLGAAQLSPDNRRLYLTRQYNIECLDLATSQKLWETEVERGWGLTTLALSSDGRLLASCSGYEDPLIRIRDVATGQVVHELNDHISWVCQLVFSKDGRQLISAATDQTIRIWDTSTWTKTSELRGHTNEVHAVAISGAAHLVASASKDGNLTLWKVDEKSVTDGYRLLPEDIGDYDVGLQDRSRVLLLPQGKPPVWIDLNRGSALASLPELGSSADVLGWFGANILCQWDRTNQILIHELSAAESVLRGAVILNSRTRPTGFTYNPTRQLTAWSEAALSNSVYLASLAAPGRRIELRSDVSGLRPIRFSEDGNYLVADGQGALRAWNVETGRIVASIAGSTGDAIFAAGGRVLVAVTAKGNDREIQFHNLAQPGQALRRVPVAFQEALAVSPDGRLVAAILNGVVWLFDPATGESNGPPLHGHLNPVYSIVFSPDGQRLISASGGREVAKLWDVSTRQELLTLSGTGSLLYAARWRADGDVILAGSPWQAWRAPSWEEIAAAEANEKVEVQQP